MRMLVEHLSHGAAYRLVHLRAVAAVVGKLRVRAPRSVCPSHVPRQPCAGLCAPYYGYEAVEIWFIAFVAARKSRSLLHHHDVPLAVGQSLSQRYVACRLDPAVASRFRTVVLVGGLVVVIHPDVPFERAARYVYPRQRDILDAEVVEQRRQVLHGIVREAVAYGQNAERVAAASPRRGRVSSGKEECHDRRRCENKAAGGAA